MRKRWLERASAWALAAALLLALPAQASGWETGAVRTPDQTALGARTAPVMLIPQDGGAHGGYMNGNEKGEFQPERPVTRGELAQMLSAVVADQPGAAPSFSDVAWDAWYAPAVGRVAGLGLMTGSGGAFRPSAAATRAEFAAALALLLPYDAMGSRAFPDVDPGHWAYEAICRTGAQGLLTGDDRGNFRPDDVLLRCEAAVVFNRLLGRQADRWTIIHMSGLCRFGDVPGSHWAYADIVEATVPHRWTYNPDGSEGWVSVDMGTVPVYDPLPPLQDSPDPWEPSAPSNPAAGLDDGPHRIDGRLYWVRGGQFVRDEKINALYFDENGCYTTGNADLDQRLNAIVEERTGSSMTQDQKLRALFDYTVANYRYLSRPLVRKGAVDWEPGYALWFLQNGRGNCFSFAAAYCLLCRELGLPAYTVVGASGSADSPHGWVEIAMDGAVYMFDPELQWYYNNRTTKKVNLFKMQPSKVPSGVYRYIW